MVTRRRNPAIHRGIARERPSLKGVVQWLPRRRLRRRRLLRSPPRRPRRRSSSSALRSTQGSWHLPAPLCVCGGTENGRMRQSETAYGSDCESVWNSKGRRDQLPPAFAVTALLCRTLSYSVVLCRILSYSAAAMLPLASADPLAPIPGPVPRCMPKDAASLPRAARAK